MYDAHIPMINYVLVTITASVLAYATAMDINDTNDTGSATESLPSLSDSYAKEPQPEPEPEPEPVKEESVPMAEAQVVPQAQSETSAFGGKHQNRKIKKTIRNARNNKKRKQTRNKNHSK